jgi:hypothetical protein
MIHSRPQSMTLAARLGAIGGGLGIVAGVAQATIGSRIPHWSGDKQDPFALGLLTVALSASALAAARTLRNRSGGRDAMIVPVVVWLVVVAAVCSTTVGRLWAVPGLLLIAAAGVTLAVCGWRPFRSEITANWLRCLLGTLAACELLMAASAAPTTTIAGGIAAGAALIAAAVLVRPGRRRVVSGLTAATLPFAIATWWAILPPLVSIVAFAIGMAGTSGAATLSHARDVTPRGIDPVGLTSR